MGYSASTCKSQPHSMIYGAQWAHLWVSAPQDNLWGTVGLLVGLSPTGPSMGHSASTCGSQPHRPIYGAQWVYLWVSAPQADLWGTVRPLVGLSPTG